MWNQIESVLSESAVLRIAAVILVIEAAVGSLAVIVREMASWVIA